MGNRECLKVLNDTKLVVNEPREPLIIEDQFGVILNHLTSPICQTSFLVWTFLPFLQQDDSNTTYESLILQLLLMKQLVWQFSGEYENFFYFRLLINYFFLDCSSSRVSFFQIISSNSLKIFLTLSLT